MNPQRIINLYHFLRRSEELKLPFTVPRLAALAACHQEPQGSGSLKEKFGASQAFWSVTLKDLEECGLLKKVTWKEYKTTYRGRTVLFVLEDTMNLNLKHDSWRVKNTLRKCKGGSSAPSEVQPLQNSWFEENHGPSSPRGEAR